MLSRRCSVVSTSISGSFRWRRVGHDLPEGRRSGLLIAIDVLRQVPGISFVYFNEKDVVRHHLVQQIIRAYERYDQSVSGSSYAGPNGAEQGKAGNTTP